MKGLYKESSQAWDIAVKEINKPIPNKDEVVIQVHYAGICGTDLKIAEGSYHSYNPPLIMGHEFSGIVVDIEGTSDDLKIGDKVVARTIIYSCGNCTQCIQGKENLCKKKKRIGFDYDGVFASYVKVNKEQIHLIPQEINLKSAVLMEPLAVVIHALRNIVIQPLDNILISGPGPIGLVAAAICKANGATVIMSGLERDNNRLSIAANLGVDYKIIVDNETDSGRERLLGLTNDNGPNIVLECSGTAEGINYGLNMCQPAGKFIQIGTKSNQMQVDFMKIAYKEIQVTGSIGHTKRDWEQAIHFMRDNSSYFTPFLSNFYSLENWNEAFDSFKNGESIKAIFSIID